MKKTVIGFIFGLVFALSVSVAAETVYQFAASKYTLYVDGVKADRQMYIYQNTNYASIRSVAEALGLDVAVNGYRVDFTSKSLETVARNVKDSCVMIYAYLPNKAIRQGSGWVYNGYIVTAKHVVEGAEKIAVFPDDSDKGVWGSIHYLDLELDVAVIKADTGLPSVTLGDSDKLKEGEKLVSITSPAGSQNTIEECTFSKIEKFTTEKYTGDFLMITDTIMEGGSSGGALFNYDGDIVAMNIGYLDKTDDILTAIPIKSLKPILEKLK
jgi:S1-C subfamily serine protease